jgi:hypothetical protein
LVHRQISQLRQKMPQRKPSRTRELNVPKVGSKSESLKLLQSGLTAPPSG